MNEDNELVPDDAVVHVTNSFILSHLDIVVTFFRDNQDLHDLMDKEYATNLYDEMELEDEGMPYNVDLLTLSRLNAMCLFFHNEQHAMKNFEEFFEVAFIKSMGDMKG